MLDHNESIRHLVKTTDGKHEFELLFIPDYNDINACDVVMSCEGKSHYLNLPLAPNEQGMTSLIRFLRDSISILQPNINAFESDIMLLWMALFAIPEFESHLSENIVHGRVIPKRHIIVFTGPNHINDPNIVTANLYKDGKVKQQLSSEELVSWLNTHPETPIYSTRNSRKLEQMIVEAAGMSSLAVGTVDNDYEILTTAERFKLKLSLLPEPNVFFTRDGIEVPIRRDVIDDAIDLRMMVTHDTIM